MSRYESCSAALTAAHTWCALDAGHPGDHADVDGRTWPRTVPPTLEPPTDHRGVPMSTLRAEAEAFLAKLGADAGHLVAEGRALFAKLLGEGEADVADVAKQAEAAAGPVAAAVEADASVLASEAVAGVEQAVTPPTA